MINTVSRFNAPNNRYAQQNNKPAFKQGFKLNPELGTKVKLDPKEEVAVLTQTARDITSGVVKFLGNAMGLDPAEGSLCLTKVFTSEEGDSRVLLNKGIPAFCECIGIKKGDDIYKFGRDAEETEATKAYDALKNAATEFSP